MASSPFKKRNAILTNMKEVGILLIFFSGKKKLICKQKHLGLQVGLGMVKVGICLGIDELYPNLIPTWTFHAFAQFQITLRTPIQIQVLD